MIDGRVYRLMSGDYLIPMNEYSKEVARLANCTVEEFFIPPQFEKVCYDYRGIIVKEKTNG